MIPSIANSAAGLHTPSDPSQSHRPTPAPAAGRAESRVQDTAQFSTRPVESTHEADSEPGAYRLLKEGHFKGVAQIRQMIHFADRIAEEQAQAQASLTNDSLTGLDGAVSEVFVGLADTQTLTEEQAAAIDQLKQAFSATIGALGGDSSSESTLSLDEINAALRDAADTLLQGLTDLTAPPPPVGDTETTPVEPVEGESTVESTLDLTDFINSLSDLLDTQIDSFIGDSQSLSILPELSGPIGQGVAYDKHLAEYLALPSPGSGADGASSEDSEPEAALDVIA